MNIRKAMIPDLSRVAEIYVFNNRINYFPIFKDAGFSFGKLQVVSLVDQYLKRKKILENIYVFDDGLIKGFIQIKGTEICQLFVEPFFQNEGIGGELIEFAIRQKQIHKVDVNEQNDKALGFYLRMGFRIIGRDETDGMGKPYPILHLQLPEAENGNK